jgi:hypothetical protein
MTGFRLLIEDGKFRDAYGRQVTLRGINVAGDAKYPSAPDQPSHIATDFFDGDNVKFTGRPFPKEDAHLHFSRLKRFGYNTIRYVFTWEAIEATGPGIYDEEWIQHTIDILRIAKEYGFYIFMDPHQDVVRLFMGHCRANDTDCGSPVVSIHGWLRGAHVDAVCSWPQPTKLCGH